MRFYKEDPTVISASQPNFPLHSENKLNLQFAQQMDNFETVGKSVKFTYDLIFPVECLNIKTNNVAAQ